MKKILTISIASHNVEKYIRDTLDSIVNASHIDELEVFVIDDGGSDATMRIAGEYHLLYPESIFLIHKDNGGWGSTVNYSIDHGTGKYLKLLDGDDYFDSSALDSFVEYLKECDTDVVCTPFRMFFDGDKSRRRYIALDNKVVCGQGYTISEVTDSVILSMHALTFKTEVLRNKRVSLMEHCFYTDSEYITKGLWACDTISFFDEPVYMYRIARDERSCGRKGYNRLFNDHRRLLDSMIEFRKSLSKENENNPLVDKMVHILVGKQYRVYLMIDDRGQSKELFWSFDRHLRMNEGELYRNAEMGRVLRVCKKIPGVGFDLARIYYRSVIK